MSPREKAKSLLQCEKERLPIVTQKSDFYYLDLVLFLLYNWLGNNINIDVPKQKVFRESSRTQVKQNFSSF